MSILQSEVPSPRQALSALRRRSPASGARPSASARSRRLGGRAIVGLDIESGYVAAVEAASGTVAVRRAAFAELPADLVQDGEIVDPSGLGSLLREFFATHNLPSRVRIGLANQRIVMRTIDLPPITDPKQLASAVRFQAQEHIAMPLEQAVLEHHPIGLVGTADGPRSRVVLVAARREMIDRVLATAGAAGLRLEGIDLSAFALIRALHRESDAEEQVAYINAGSTTNLAVASGPRCLFTRVVSVGADAMVSDLAGRRGLAIEHSRAWLRHVGAGRPIDQIEGEPDIVAATREVLVEGIGRMASDIRATLDFYSDQAGVAVTERAVLTGPTVSIPGFAEQLGEDLGLPVEVRVVAESEPGAFGGIDPGQLSVAAGLTLTEAPA